MTKKKKRKKDIKMIYTKKRREGAFSSYTPLLSLRPMVHTH